MKEWKRIWSSWSNNMKNMKERKMEFKVSREGVVISDEDEKGKRTVVRNFMHELGNTNFGERRGNIIDGSQVEMR